MNKQIPLLIIYKQIPLNNLCYCWQYFYKQFETLLLRNHNRLLFTHFWQAIAMSADMWGINWPVCSLWEKHSYFLLMNQLHLCVHTAHGTDVPDNHNKKKKSSITTNNGYNNGYNIHHYYLRITITSVSKFLYTWIRNQPNSYRNPSGDFVSIEKRKTKL